MYHWSSWNSWPDSVREGRPSEGRVSLLSLTQSATSWKNINRSWNRKKAGLTIRAKIILKLTKGKR